MNLKKVPSVIEKNKFNEKGLVETVTGLLVPAYVGSGFGFNEPGREWLNKIFYPRLKELGVLALCPFAACAEYLDFSKIEGDISLKDYIKFWEDFNNIIGPVNYETLMPNSKLFIAILEGHYVDEGLVYEIADFAHKNYGPIIGIRSDFRLAENIAALINPAVRYGIDKGPYNHKFFYGPDAYENAFKAIKTLADKIKKE